MKLTREQLFTLEKAAEIRAASLVAYEMDARNQVKLWQFETKEVGLRTDQFTQDMWLLDVSGMIDAVQMDAPIYLLADEIEAGEHFDEPIIDAGPRIVMWRRLVGFFGNKSAVLYVAGTSRYMSFLGTAWVPEAVGMLAVSGRPATPRPVGTTERYSLARAKYRPRRDFYYVSNARYEPTKRPSRGGHHASPVAHDRSAHQALLTRVSLEEDEVADLRARGYVIQVTEDLPAEVVERMHRRGKQPWPGALNAWRWIEKSASRVNPDGELARRVTLIRDGSSS